VTGVCGDAGEATTVDLPPVQIVKSVNSNVQGADGSWTITYSISVTNPSTTMSTTYELSDRLKFGGNITITSAAVAGPHPTDPGWNGITHTRVVGLTRLGRSAADVYHVTVTATVAATATSTQRDCTLQPGENGTGFLNSATATVGSQHSTDTACAAPGSPTTPPAPPTTPPAPPTTPPASPLRPAPPGPATQSPLPLTGVPVAQLLATAILLVGSGALLLVLTGWHRRERRPGSQRG
jgi:hypothetical protein